MATGVSGTEGYAEEAEDLLKRYESVPFEASHRAVMHLMPQTPSRVLDIGAGTGRDAGYFADQGHEVVAVEPTDALRLPAMALHPSPDIEWVDDYLPDLTTIRHYRGTFDLVTLSPVWMHLDEVQRECGMAEVAQLVKPGGTLILTLRHGSVPEGRRMFDVSAAETIELAAKHSLESLLNLEQESVSEWNRKKGITWSRLAFEKTG